MQGYRDALAWLLKNGKIPFGVADADVSDTADSAGEVPAWRRRMQATLASVQAQVQLCSADGNHMACRQRHSQANERAGGSDAQFLMCVQMAEGAAVLRDSAQAAVGCDAAAEDLVSGKGPFAASSLVHDNVGNVPIQCCCPAFWASFLGVLIPVW